jgi:hypothetical protein
MSTINREYAYRDCMTIAIRGAAEIPIIYGRPNVVTETEVIELSYPRSQPPKGNDSRLQYYWNEIEKIDPRGRKKRLHHIWSIDRLTRRKEQIKVDYQIEQLGITDLELTGEVEQDVDIFYEIAGQAFLTREDLVDYIKGIKDDFLVANYLANDYREFLVELARQYFIWQNQVYWFPGNGVRRPHSVITKESIVCQSSQVKRNFGMSMLCNGYPLQPEDCVYPVMALTHHQILSSVKL